MNKVVKVTEDEVFIGKDDGSVVKTEKSNATWDVKVGDVVELFVSGDTVILNLAKKVKEKKENSFVKKTVNLCQKTLPMIFSSLFAIFLVALLVISFVPRGNKYTFEAELMGLKVTSTITFKGDEMELVNSTSTEVFTSKYKIEDGKLYEFNTETNKYDFVGEITSTKLTMSAEDLGFSMEYKENTMIALRTMSIVFMIIFAVLDTAAIAVMLLTKKGVIKLNNSSTAVVNAEPEKTEEVTAE